MIVPPSLYIPPRPTATPQPNSSPSQGGIPQPIVPVSTPAPAILPVQSVVVSLTDATSSHVSGTPSKGDNVLAPLGRPIPVQYGRLETWPELIAPIYTTTAGSDIYYHLLYCVGQGEFSVESVKLNGAPIAQSPNTTGEIIAPGGVVTLYPSRFEVALSVSQNLTDGYAGPYIVNATGSLADMVRFEFVFPWGLYTGDANGGINNASVSLSLERQKIDDAGNPLDSWTLLGTQTVTKATTLAFAQSFDYALVAGRYQVRLRRTVAEPGGYVRDRVQLVQLSSSRTSHPNYGNVTVAAVKIKAQAALSQFPRLSLICTRKIPAWNGTAWTANTATRSIIWALCDIVRANYGARKTDAMLDKAALLTLDAALSSRGDYCDVRFVDRQTCMDAIKSLALLGRLIPFIDGGILRLVRDQDPAGNYVQLFTPLNIIEGSFSVEYKTAGPDNPDSALVEYLDTASTKIKSVPASLGTSDNPEQIRLIGCTSRTQAYREGMFWRATQAYRRIFVKFSTAQEARMVYPGDSILVCHDALSWGQWGEVYRIDASTLTLSNPVDFSGQSTATLRFRDINGAPTSALTVTPNSNPYLVNYTGSIPAGTYSTVANDARSQRTAYAFDNGSAQIMACKVLSISPRENGELFIEAVADDGRVYTADTGAVPAETPAFDLDYDPLSAIAQGTPPPVQGGGGGGGAGGGGGGGVSSLPPVAGPTLRFANLRVNMASGWIVTYLATWDATGYSTFQVEAQMPGGGWNVVYGSVTATRSSFSSGNLYTYQAIRVTPYLNGALVSGSALTVTFANFSKTSASTAVTGLAVR